MYFEQFRNLGWEKDMARFLAEESQRTDEQCWRIRKRNERVDSLKDNFDPWNQLLSSSKGKKLLEQIPQEFHPDELVQLPDTLKTLDRYEEAIKFYEENLN